MSQPKRNDFLLWYNTGSVRLVTDYLINNDDTESLKFKDIDIFENKHIHKFESCEFLPSDALLN